MGKGFRRQGWEIVAAVVAMSMVLASLTESAAGSAPANNVTSKKDAPALNAATFADPPATVRPCYRWWMPLAFTSDQELEAEIDQIAASGAGCIEVSAFAVPGAANQTPEFLKTYGWGTELWAHRMSVISEAAAREGIAVDANLGPNYPPTVPTMNDINNPAAAQQLLYGNASVAGGAAFSGALPVPSTAPPAGAKSTLVAVVAGQCVAPNCLAAPQNSVMLDRSTMVDLTGKVDRSTNRLNWTAPAGAAMWEVVAFWQTADGQSKKAMTATSPNYVVDHLSALGARTLTSYLDEKVLTKRELALVAQLGRGGIFEDSLEMGSTMKWTWDLLQEFKARRGYDVTTLLPALAGSGAQGTTTPAFDFTDQSGARIRWDYRQTWSDLYIDRYAKTLQDWAAGHGMYFRAQSYGAPIATGVAAQVVGVPEGESINFGSPNPYGAEQNYRVVSAGAHLAGKTRISTECCGIFLGAYRSTVAGLDINQTGGAIGTIGANDAHNGNLDSIYKAFAGGVTQLVWHGFPYCCAPPGAAGSSANGSSGEGGVWPGYNPWVLSGAINVSEMFGPRLPMWDDARGVNDNLARLQLALRQGHAHPDFAVYYHDVGLSGQTLSPQETPSHMMGSASAAAQAGYTYDYVHPSMLGTAADFKHGELFGKQAGYRALVLNNQLTMPVAAAKRILALAKAGMPVVVVGLAPRSTPGDFDAAEQDAELAAVMQELLALGNVEQVPAESGLPAALTLLGVSPAAQLAGSGTLDTVRRTTANADYYFFYNGGAAPLTREISLTGHGAPLLLDTWSGEVTPIAEFQTSGDRVSLSITVPANDQRLIVITRSPRKLGIKPHGVHAVSSTAPELRYERGRLVARSTKPGIFTTKLSTGRTATTTIAGLPPAQRLTTWTLRAQTWAPGATYNLTTKTWQPSFSVTASPDGRLPSWLTILTPVDLHAASGVGEYTTTVEMPADWGPSDGAYLNLGQTADTVQVAVNGHAINGINQSHPDGIEVGPYLRAGTNTIVVRVATTLYNAVHQYASSDLAYQAMPPQAMGLLGPVELEPYSRAVIPPGKHSTDRSKA